jgi:hypothetical protein
MNIATEKNKAYLWGAVGGAVIASILGFTWGGWVTGSTASKNATQASREAVVAALAPICATGYRAQADGTTKVTELTKVSMWERGTVIEKSGFATMPGSKSSDSDVARACAEILATPPKA